MKVIGLTGGIASGKSTVSAILRQKGAYIIDADEIAREIVKPGKPAWKEIVDYFGSDILNEDGSIKRRKLGRIVFSDDKKLAVLNRITHPRIVEEIKKELEACRQRNEKVVVVDAALLLEIGLDMLVDEVWLVSVDEKTQVKRLIERERSISYTEALERIRAQMPLEEKLKFATRVIDNNGDIENTKKQVDRIWREIEKSWEDSKHETQQSTF
ncbi:dephospho-CoA kinase [Thermosediminibacter oceani]|uniref:Dephospho-CoA kinase n=1 Tax=Thermosediminibacter oceani (strain ATCC BAA-1034 / DSM 16646 / JW/IW-1228P) TaxID=555079 RepID=D9RYG5_THEOJ|nr:dephospho-CoA kinase [Thermosediminibacter oceani]ADL08389.1 dephospho-CoA kinase [Thermosediminibacter oceani DSM 16646]